MPFLPYSKPLSTIGGEHRLTIFICMKNSDLQLLQERINEQRDCYDFYKSGVRVILDSYKLHLIMEEQDFREKYESLELPEEFYSSIIKGEVPPEEVLKSIDVEDLDRFVTDSLFLIGITRGILYIHHVIEVGSYTTQTQDFLDFITDSLKSGKNPLQVMGFAALTLWCSIPPSQNILFQMFPVTDDVESLENQGVILREIQSDIIARESEPEKLESIYRS